MVEADIEPVMEYSLLSWAIENVDGLGSLRYHRLGIDKILNRGS